MRSVWVGFVFACVRAQSPEASAVSILETRCQTCHGEARMSDLDLRTREALLKGGKRGPAIIPGNAAESLLYRAVRREGDIQMPPGKEALSVAETSALRSWIESGAVWPESAARRVESAWWAFRKPIRPVAPGAGHPVDAFISAKLREKGLTALPPADKQTLVRRAYFDLHGLPPAPEEVAAFVSDTSPKAWENLIDRLLASPRYGERWGRHWLDVVRYADTGGYETDILYANAWRYRDYVIQSFNNDKPYDVLIREQIAADEIWPDNLDLNGSYDIPKEKLANLHRRMGTALYTTGPMAVEYTFFGDQFRAEWQAEAVETTGAAFLGLTLNCARCHDHKFDPLPQRDFYRMAANFAGSEEREIPIVSRMGYYEYTRYQTKVWIVDQLRAKLERLDASVRQRAGAGRKGKAADTLYTPAERDQRETLLRQIGSAYVETPKHYATASVLAHSDFVPDTHILVRGDFANKGEKVGPGFLAALGGSVAASERAGNRFLPERRKALAEWIASRDNPLTARVMINRIWQGHFARGIVATPNDFGRQGDPPSHPELLDWLAVEFMERGWSMKQMHRLLMTSETYRRSSAPHAANTKLDPDNVYLWRGSRRRLEAEALRDAVLTVAGTLNTKAGGPPVVLPLDREEQEGMRAASEWPVTLDESEHDRRSVYLFVKRSFRLPLLETFDAPAAIESCSRREVSTVAPQALALMNGRFTAAQAQKFASRLRKECGANPEATIDRAWRLAIGRAPADDEKARARQLLARAPLERLCLLLFNLSEFVYVD